MPQRPTSADPRQARWAFLIKLQHELRTPTSAIIGYARMLLERAPEAVVGNLNSIQTAGEQLLQTVDALVSLNPLEGVQVDRDQESFGAELRAALGTPMHVILGYCEIIEENTREIGDESFARDVKHIVDATNRLLQVTEDQTRAAESEQGHASAAQPHHAGTQGDDLRKATANTASESKAPALSHPRSAQDVHVLVVDDDDMNRDLLVRYLQRQGFLVDSAEHGGQALTLLHKKTFDLVLLDIIMPEVDGFEVLQQMNADPTLKHVPVIVVSAMDDIDSVVRCIELGAAEYLPKTFNRTLFDAKVSAMLERKYMHDQAQIHLAQLDLERDRSEQLLSAILPSVIAERLKLGETTIADAFDQVTVLFCDIVGFTPLSSKMSPQALVARLNDLFVAFDDVLDGLGVEKIKTMGDAYLAVAGVPRARKDHDTAAANAALAMMDTVEVHNRSYDEPIRVRIGLHSGPVVAGVIGTKRFVYDVWGDTVNVASRMESQGVPGRIQVSELTRQLLGDKFGFEPLGELEVRGKGRLSTFLLIAPESTPGPSATSSNQTANA